MTQYVNLEFIDEPIYKHNSQILRIGTDCSGIEAPIQALQQLGIQHKHVFSSDIDKYCIQSIKANYHPERIYGDPEGPYPDGDMRNRNHSELPDIDLYVCGFPCQPFSTAGKRLGLEDKRGNVFFSCIDVIRTKQPKYFILENVKGLLYNNKGKTFNTILTSLKNLENFCVYWDVLNTKDYGIPQHRARIFIIGIRNDIHNHPFNFPIKTPINKISDYIDNDDQYTHPIPQYVIKSKMLDKVPSNAVFVDFGFTKHKHPYSGIYTPAINAGGGLWCVKHQRYANIKELLSLQGFPKNFKQVVSNTQLKKQIGNSMSVNVLKEIIKTISKTDLVRLYSP